jgi:hypothetical protein
VICGGPGGEVFEPKIIIGRIFQGIYQQKVQNNAKFNAKQYIEKVFLTRKCFHFTLFSAKRVLLPAQTKYST